METRTSKWDERMLGLAQHIAQWSNKTNKVGCVITTPDFGVVGTGYNGCPDGSSIFNKIKNTEAAFAMFDKSLCAELVAIIQVPNIAGCRVYVYGGHPCSSCATILLRKQIKFIYCQELHKDNASESEELASLLLKNFNGLIYKTYTL